MRAFRSGQWRHYRRKVQRNHLAIRKQLTLDTICFMKTSNVQQLVVILSWLITGGKNISNNRKTDWHIPLSHTYQWVWDRDRLIHPDSPHYTLGLEKHPWSFWTYGQLSSKSQSERSWLHHGLLWKKHKIKKIFLFNRCEWCIAIHDYHGQNFVLKTLLFTKQRLQVTTLEGQHFINQEICIQK